MTRSEVRARPTALDLFCGAGGLTIGLQRAGFEVMGAVDAWKPAVHTYSLNHNHRVCQADISKLTPEHLWRALDRVPAQIDLIAGGPPCQGFSVQRIGEDQDDRNHLILEFARLVCSLRPRMFLMENVPGLLGKRGQQLANLFEATMRDAGFAVTATRVNAADYGVPQIRKRVIYIGWLSDDMRPFTFPMATHTIESYITVQSAIGDLPPPPEDGVPTQDDPLHKRTKLSALNLERLRLVPPGGGMQDLPVHLRVDCHKNGAERIGHRYVYGRLAPNKPAGTITAHFDSFTRGKFAHPFQDRNITLREGARLQSFDDSYQFRGTQEEIAALIGNAVPPLLAEVIARAIFGHLVGYTSGATAFGRQRSASKHGQHQMSLSDLILAG